MTTRANVNGEHTTHPSHYQTSHYSSSSSSSASFKGCCCCLFLLFTFLALLLIAVVLVILLVIKPKKPQFDLQQVGVQYIIVTAPSDGPTSAYLSLNISMIFTAVNPNKVGIKYSSSGFYVMYKGVPLGKATVPSFYQPANSVRTVETRVSVDKVDVMQANALDLVKDATLNDRVELSVTGEVGAKIRIIEITSPRVQVSVDCTIVISPRKQSLTYKQCGVDGVSV
ncbi:late embryogenesis abundant (LEA) hydroxyproline-rich glycoprotein family [Tasmannia lanceolata]|uniref:late embryogenesis abundant (LEA) hydroxyproline-rich glycoprotein family n=1 Tax=Tasmannia lanceolata TaxID=3420 RepID=UPI004063CBD4